MTVLKTPWDGHWMYGDYIGFLHHALGQKFYVDAYRKASGNKWTPAGTVAEQMVDQATGADLAFLQGFSDWIATNIFGTPDDVFGNHPIANGETVH
ncbi:hypothetical protein [Pseudomonas monteilii]|uniref:hypothetical protein n=1 Tax=Pseudomonas monteilii TaxID=76759 RepID=UPI00137658E8|nr:hypothetical protein [Pseudomonas monteilii]NBB07873.1 hypothetical protein [Pseudomonas monteilii]